MPTVSLETMPVEVATVTALRATLTSTLKAWWSAISAHAPTSGDASTVMTTRQSSTRRARAGFECGLSEEALACIKDGTVAKDQGLDCLRALYVGDPDSTADDGDALRSTECLEGTTTGGMCDPACTDEAPFCNDTTNECLTCLEFAPDDPNAACAALDPDTPICNDGACVECIDGGEPQRMRTGRTMREQSMHTGLYDR